MATDRKALRLLLSMYRNGYSDPGISDEETEYGKIKGIIFDPIDLDHDELISRLLRARQEINPIQVGCAFAISLITRRLELRSVLGSYAVFKCFEDHERQPFKGYDCEFCGGVGKPYRGPFNLTLYNFERFKFGGCRHQYSEYAMFDMEQFRLSEVNEVPSKEAWLTLSRLRQVADNIPSNARANALIKEISSVFKGIKKEYSVCMEILGYAGILQPTSMPSFFDKHVRMEESIPRTDRSDLNYPIDWWAGSDGVNWERVDYWFPELRKYVAVGKSKAKKISPPQDKSAVLNKLLSKLLSALESISTDHEEVTDTDVREELATAIYCGFIAPEKSYQLPQSFEMFSDEGDQALRKALAAFFKAACPIADKLGWTEAQRQSAFQDPNVTSAGGLTYDEFFGHAD
jgi:hypothetical protein